MSHVTTVPNAKSEATASAGNFSNTFANILLKEERKDTTLIKLSCSGSDLPFKNINVMPYDRKWILD